MKLYFSPGACSLSVHIALREAGLAFDLEQVDIKAHKTKSGADFYAINPKGAVPTLLLDNGHTLTEGAAIVQYVADRKPESKLAPSPTSEERYHLQEWLNYLASEVHKTFGPLFNPNLPEASREVQKASLAKAFDFLSKNLDGKKFLMGDTFTVADGYLFTLLRWTKAVGIDLAKWPILAAYRGTIDARPAVKEAIEAEAKSKAAA
jgi:glutathione S-transferase